jgi:hypothetical protein
MRTVEFTVNGPTGAVVPGALVYVYLTGTSTLAPITTLSGTAIVQPIVADVNGLVSFQTVNGTFDLQATSGSWVSPLITQQQIVDVVTLANQVGAINVVGLYGNAVMYATVSAMNADLAHAAGTLGLVYNQPGANGTYVKSGASGTGAWTLTSLLADNSVITALQASFTTFTTAALANVRNAGGPWGNYTNLTRDSAGNILEATSGAGVKTIGDLAVLGTVSGPGFAKVPSSSSSPITVGLGEIAFLTPPKVAYPRGHRLRLISQSSGAYVEGVVKNWNSLLGSGYVNIWADDCSTNASQTIIGGTYTSSSGALTLYLAGAMLTGSSVTISGLSGSGSGLSSANGTYTVASGSAANVIYCTIASGLAISSITGGNVASVFTDWVLSSGYSGGAALQGTAAPAPNFGQDHQFYYQTSTGSTFVRINGVWTQIASLILPATGVVYVSNVAANGLPVGNDSTGTGTAAAPYQTLSKALSVAAGVPIWLNGVPGSPTAYTSSSPLVITASQSIQSILPLGASITTSGTSILFDLQMSGGQTLTIGQVILDGLSATATLLNVHDASAAYTVTLNGTQAQNWTGHLVTSATGSAATKLNLNMTNVKAAAGSAAAPVTGGVTLQLVAAGAFSLFGTTIALANQVGSDSCVQLWATAVGPTYYEYDCAFYHSITSAQTGSVVSCLSLYGMTNVKVACSNHVTNGLGASGQTNIDCIRITTNPWPRVASGSYNSGTGLVTLTLVTPNPGFTYSFTPGQTITVTYLATAGGYYTGPALGTFTTGSGTNSTTVTYTIATGLTIAAFTDGTIQQATPVSIPSTATVYGNQLLNGSGGGCGVRIGEEVIALIPAGYLTNAGIYWNYVAGTGTVAGQTGGMHGLFIASRAGGVAAYNYLKTVGFGLPDLAGNALWMSNVIINAYGTALAMKGSNGARFIHNSVYNQDPACVGHLLEFDQDPTTGIHMSGCVVEGNALVSNAPLTNSIYWNETATGAVALSYNNYALRAGGAATWQGDKFTVNGGGAGNVYSTPQQWIAAQEPTAICADPGWPNADTANPPDLSIGLPTPMVGIVPAISGVATDYTGRPFATPACVGAFEAIYP